LREEASKLNEISEKEKRQQQEELKKNPEEEIRIRQAKEAKLIGETEIIAVEARDKDRKDLLGKKII
jgi:hypothetical protein